MILTGYRNDYVHSNQEQKSYITTVKSWKSEKNISTVS
jgi:hypothetical protein